MLTKTLGAVAPRYYHTTCPEGHVNIHLLVTDVFYARLPAGSGTAGLLRRARNDSYAGPAPPDPPMALPRPQIYPGSSAPGPPNPLSPKVDSESERDFSPGGSPGVWFVQEQLLDNLPRSR